jgi:hypothetical protein
MDFENPLLTGLGVSIDFLVVFLLDELVPVVVQCSNDGVYRRRGRHLCDHCCPTSRDQYGIPTVVIAGIKRLQKAMPAVVFDEAANV